jgi:hypothetical protein
LASVILPLPESDLKTELNFSVNDSNTLSACTYNSQGTFSAGTYLRQNEDYKVLKLIMQGENYSSAFRV